MFIELGAAILAAWPWHLRVSIGHFLPLSVALLCAWSLRTQANSLHALVFAVAVAMAGYMVWETARLVVTPVAGGTAYGIGLSVHYVVWIAVLSSAIAALSSHRVPLRALFLGSFTAIYIADVLCVLKVWPGDYSMLYQALGGAGLVDALFVGPVASALLGGFVSAVIRHRSQIDKRGAAWAQAVRRLVPTRFN